MSIYAQYKVPDADTMLALGVGQPCPYYFEIMQSLPPTEKPLDVFQYGMCVGSSKYRTAVANMLTTFTGAEVNADQLYMTNGVSQAVFMLSALFRGKHVFVEDPTYFIMLKTFTDLGYESHTLDLARLDSFDDELGKLFDANPDQTIITYIVPFYQNPTGKTIDEDIINSLAGLCDKYPKLMILSDETYQMVSFDGTKHKSLSWYHKNILSLGTFSKILAPACRLGWIHTTNTDIIHFLDETGFMDSGGSVNPIIGFDVANIISLPLFSEHLILLRKSLFQKSKLLFDALSLYPDCFEVNPVNGGYFLWVKSKLISATQLLDIAKTHKVSFHVGSKFSHKKNYGDYFRLSFSYYKVRDLKLFSERLEKIVKDVQSVVHNFGSLIAEECVKNVRSFVTQINVHILGCKGKLGSLIADECIKNSYNVFEIPRDCAIKLHIPHDKIDRSTEKNIVVDVSSPLGTKTLLEYLLEHKIYVTLIIGTTGELPIDLIEEYKKYANVHIKPNFSIGVNMIDSMLQTLEPHYWTADIYDLHHIAKKDAPSGTAKRFKTSMESAVDTEIKIKSERIGGVVGHHEINLESECETIKITHIAHDRRIFAKGCVQLIKQILLSD
jgi:2-aminoadipate transaminase